MIVQSGTSRARWFRILKRSDGTPLTTGTVTYYLRNNVGANETKWWDDSGSVWSADEVAARSMMHVSAGMWVTASGGPLVLTEIDSAAWIEGDENIEYFKVAEGTGIEYMREVQASDIRSRIINNLNATVSSRSSHNAAAVKAAIEAVGTKLTDIHGKLPTGNLGDATAANQSAIAGAIAGLPTPGDATAANQAAIAGAIAGLPTPGDATAANQAAIAGAIAGLPVPGDATAANQATILARLGSIAGSGANTVLGFFRALFSKSAATPSDMGGTADPAADSLEAIRERGDAAWTTGGLAGSCHITITVKETDGSGDPVPDLRVDIRADGGSSTLDSRTTDENGVIDAYLDPAAYDVYLRNLGTHSAVNIPEDITVAAEGDAFELYVTPFDAGVLGSDSTCVVIVGEVEGDNEIPSDTVIRARPIAKNTFTAAANLVAFKEVSANVDETGKLQIALLRGEDYFIEVGTANAPGRDFSGARSIPDAASKLLNALESA